MRPFRFPTSSAAVAAASTAASATAFSAHAQLVTSRAAFLGKLFGGGSKKTDDTASADGDGDAAPKRKLPTNPLGLAKDMYQVTKAAKEMSNAVNAAKGKGGVDAFAESQLAQFRSLLELQKQMATQAGGDKGNPSALDQKKMAQMMEQSSALFEKMLLPMEQQITRKSRGDAAAASGPTPAQIAAAAAAGHKKFPQQEYSTSSDAGSGNASSSSSTATAQDGGGGGNNSGLPPEIAELFAELRAMRTKKNEYRDKYRAADQELSGTKQQLAKAQAHEADLRKRLAAAEAKSNEQHARNLELDDAKDQLSAQVKKLHAELSRAQPAVAASAQAQQRQVEQELAKTRKREAELANEVVRLERKLRRLRRHSPMGDVSDLLAELSRLGTETNVPFGAGDMESAFGGSSSGNDARSEEDLLDAAADQQLALESGGHLRHEFRAGVADDAFDACREKYERIVALRFAEDSREVGVSDAVARVALEVLRARLPCALLDCVLVVGSQAAVDEIRALADRHNSSGNNTRGGGGGSSGGESGGSGSRWTVTAEQNAGLQSFTVTVAESSDVASDQIVLGPYGYLACTFALRKQQQGGSGAALLPTAVYPVASPALLANTKRVQILTDRARSSKPGGQASNVGETKITHRLLIDGGLFASAFSQDTRSAMFNTGTAMDRLLKERVPAVNQRLRGSVKPLVGKDAGANAITTAAPSLATCLGSIAEDPDTARAAAVRFVLLQTSGIAPASEEQQQQKK